jgi:uncharacterized protein YkwD
VGWAKSRTTEMPAVARPDRNRSRGGAAVAVVVLLILAGAGLAATDVLMPSLWSSGDVQSTPTLPMVDRATATTTPTAGAPTTTRPVTHATTRPGKPVAPVATAMPGLENAVLSLTNTDRAAHHCAPLRMDKHLLNAARLHSADMAGNGYFSHTGRDGRDPGKRMAAAGYDISLGWAENIAAGYPTADAVMAGWLGSAGHRANIENCALHSIGIGVAQAGGGALYWTADFGGR